MWLLVLVWAPINISISKIAVNKFGYDALQVYACI